MATQTHPHRPFTRSLHDRMIAGVLGGIAWRMGWNPALLRLAFVLVTVVSMVFPAVLLYLILWLLMPEEGY
ncbi:MAG TPA: PspC domain-containing protein [Lysobacter sp.]|nr:PspC domain-containing protein [Lysobacter sp.]